MMMEGEEQRKKLNKRQKKLVRRLIEMFKPHVEEEVCPSTPSKPLIFTIPLTPSASKSASAASRNPKYLSCSFVAPFFLRGLLMLGHIVDYKDGVRFCPV